MKSKTNAIATIARMYPITSMRARYAFLKLMLCSECTIPMQLSSEFSR